ncbi:amiloride-sensitive sodium channel-related [Holotrichia oblita]|uniref:Amiloride-sensitive sodium channel-related n=1 Tax=Holotrichia oblita TaxID=644536 RepID=A0ACB9T6Z2_HOLOL|nr:amiloride-sensitive sodium channel-related [Holotrichia oblita]
MNRYQDSPVLNVITSTGYPVWKSPFPTVAVCNHNVVYKSNSGNITKILAVKEEPFYTGGAGLGSGLTVTINVEPTQYISSVKTIPGVTELSLLGTIGGTFGLCMGGSVISMLEFLFYFIQALFGKRFIEKQKKRNNKPHTWKINVLPNTQKIHSLHM